MPRPQRARPAADILASLLSHLPPEPDPGPVPSPSVPTSPPSARPPRLSPKDAAVRFDRLPAYVRSHPALKDSDKTVYAAVLSLCWRDLLWTSATNAQIRRALGGTDRVQQFRSKDGRSRTRTVKATGRSDDSIRRSLARLVGCLLVRLEDDPMTLSTRRICLLDLPSLPYSAEAEGEGRDGAESSPD